MKDSVITEIHQIKDAIARENGYDVRAIMAAVRRQARVPAKRLVRPGKKRKLSA
jgi:hypothetical protein